MEWLSTLMEVLSSTMEWLSTLMEAEGFCTKWRGCVLNGGGFVMALLVSNGEGSGIVGVGACSQR